MQNKTNRFSSCTIQLPDWVEQALPGPDHTYPTPEGRMQLMIDLARTNIAQGGGPFAAGIFDPHTGSLIAPGVNLVITNNCSVLHAEIVAITLAQQMLETYRLRDKIPNCQLVATTEPCAMCLGAVVWAGIKSLVTAARDEDARAIGFDEGDKPADWTQTLRNRGIAVQTDLLRNQAIQVLTDYQRQGRPLYNG